jgi:hypothetical protein
MSEAIDASMLLDSGAAGLADREVRCREPQDRYRNLPELVDAIVHLAGASSFQDVHTLIKCLYQFHHTLPFSDRHLQRCLAVLIDRLRRTTDAKPAVGKVEIIAPGTLLDQKTMMSLNYGTTVNEPLGVIVYDPQGKVARKAMVLCR